MLRRLRNVLGTWSSSEAARQECLDAISAEGEAYFAALERQIDFAERQHDTARARKLRAKRDDILRRGEEMRLHREEMRRRMEESTRAIVRTDEDIERWCEGADPAVVSLVVAGIFGVCFFFLYLISRL
jgi:hypothetical protein